MSSVSLQNDSSGTIKPDFDKLYEYGNEIGKGRYASVKKCFCKKTRKCYAAKVIKNFRTKNAKLNLNIVENEITALTIANCHPSIVNLYDVFYNRSETILLLEYATEKDLHIYLDNEGAFEEEVACRITYQVLKAIEFLHSKQLLHLDIKPENVLLMNPLSPKRGNLSGSDASLETERISEETTSENAESQKYRDVMVKLCDFSFSQIMVPGKPIYGMMGTVAYSAPEVLQYDALTKATDMWSLGVLTHVILTAYTPFGNGTEELNQTQTSILSVREKDFECTEDYFDEISSDAKDFIENLIKFKPKQRLTIEQALNHSWFKKYNIDTSEFEAVSTTQADLETVSVEDDKENFAQEKCLKNTQNTTCIKLLSTTTNNIANNNKADNISLNLSNNTNKLKDDKNNNNLSLLSDQQETASLTQIVTEMNSFDQTHSHVIIGSTHTSQLGTSRKTSSGGLDNLIDITSFTIATSIKLANENLESAN